MPKLEIEVTDELMDKIQEAAKECLVSPEHWATCRLSDTLRKKKQPDWISFLSPLFRSLAQTLEIVTEDDSNIEDEAGA